MRRRQVLGELYRLPQQRSFAPGSKQAARARIWAAIAEIDRQLERLTEGDAWRSIGEAARERVEELRKRRRRLMAQMVS
jgi:hypothetical protein